MAANGNRLGVPCFWEAARSLLLDQRRNCQNLSGIKTQTAKLPLRQTPYTYKKNNTKAKQKNGGAWRRFATNLGEIATDDNPKNFRLR